MGGIINDDMANLSNHVQPNTVDFVLWDPPYGIGNSKIEHKEKKWKKSAEDWDTFNSVQEQYDSYKTNIETLVPLLKDTGSIFAFGSLHNIYFLGDLLKRHFGFWIVNSIVWFKDNAFFSVTRQGLIESCEHIIWAAKTKDYFFDYEKSKLHNGGTQLRNCWKSSITHGSERVGHPHQKPLWLITRMLDIGCPDKGFVLDPMCGSATTGIACEIKGLDYLLVEKEPKYYEMAKQRIENHRQNHIDLFE